ncbi:MAG TPA: hypothetical protein ENK05_03085 [Gammaproteobacteria bacterium]|nr:hypothetical protein [Gammaproteobacteria bacterium]
MLSLLFGDPQSMAPLSFGLLSLALAGALACLFQRIWRNFRRARIIEDTATARLRSAPQGYVELEGTAHPLAGRQLLAPLTGTPCVWYRYRIEERRRYGRRASAWTEVESGTSEIPFRFSDTTGECLVDPRRAEVVARSRRVWFGSHRRPRQGREAGFLSLFSGRRYRYTEERIGAGRLYLLGWFETRRGNDVAPAEETRRLLRRWKSDQQELKRRFDANGDGVLDGREWQQARRAASEQVLQRRAARAARPVVHLVHGGESADHPFLISDRPQAQLVSRYRLQALFALAGSLAAAAVLAWLFASRY